MQGTMHTRTHVEVDPRVTTAEHLQALRQHGLSRISLGVQDIDHEVLRLSNGDSHKQPAFL